MCVVFVGLESGEICFFYRSEAIVLAEAFHGEKILFKKSVQIFESMVWTYTEPWPARLTRPTMSPEDFSDPKIWNGWV